MSLIKFLKHYYFLIFPFIFILLNIIYYNAIDDFAPEHIGVALQFLKNNTTDVGEYHFFTLPAYYTFIIAFLELTNINPFLLPKIPILLSIYIIIMTMFIYYNLKKDKYLTVIFIFFFFTISRTGSHQIFLWPHGFGDILFFLIVYLITNTYWYKAKNVFLIFLFSTCLVYISYNISYLLILYLTSLFIIFIFEQKIFIFKNIEKTSSLTIFLILSVLLVFNFNLSIFSFKFIKLLSSTSIFENIFYSIYSFISRHFSSIQPFSEFYLKFTITVPKIVTLLYIIKYILYISIISYSIKYVINKKNYLTNRNHNRLYFAFMFTTIIYSATRLIIGQLDISNIFYILLVAIFIINFNNKRSLPLLICLYILIIVNLSTIYLSSDITQRDDYSYINISSKFYFSYSLEHIYTIDEMTYGWYFTSYSKLLPYINYNSEPLYLPVNMTKNIYNNMPITVNNIVVINYNLKYYAIQHWAYLISLKTHKNNIENSMLFQIKIYDGQKLSIYKK